MNEPIEKLFDQALAEFKAENKYATVVVPDPVQRDFVEKFARLIVRECLNEIESQRSNGENADQWTITRDLCYHNMMSGLKQHFGVE